MRVILRRQRREVAGKVYHPVDACDIQNELVEGLCLAGLCEVAKPAQPGDKKPVVDAVATKKAVDAGKKTKAAHRTAQAKAAKPAPKKKPDKADTP